MPTTTQPPRAWADLIEAVTLLAQHPANDISPFWCEHDQLHVCADDEAFAPEEIVRLEELGFNRDTEGGFYSFRYGSA